MTQPPSNAQSSRILPRRPTLVHHTHSTPPFTSPPPHSPLPETPPSSTPSLQETGLSDKIAHESALDFAASSWDLATGGLKTLTAKRELPPRLDRRPSEQLPDTTSVPRSYTFALVILACIVVMLISGGVVLFMLIQP